MRPLRIAGYTALAIVTLVAVGCLAIYLTLRASLPQLDGELAAPTLQAATIARDEQGTPTIRAASRRDLAFATGYAHGQDRFFQMDLMRRAAAGELAELLGKPVLELDEKYRIHGFRRIASAIVQDSAAVDRELLDAYTAGVNYALTSAGARPWEYTLLRSQPVPWRVEDSVLVAFSMYLNLNDSSGAEELARARLHEVLPRPLYDFLYPLGTEWDAPIVGGTWKAPPIPGAEVFDLRSADARTAALNTPPSPGTLGDEPFVGSNSWAVAGPRTKDNAALFANDMHLSLRLPHIWYRARLIVESGAEAPRDLVGVTLPGLPMLIAGSNGRVAWGYTNSYGDFSDIVVVDIDPQDPARYLTDAGSEPFVNRDETLAIRGGKPAYLVVQSTRWGPIVDYDDAGRPLVLAWTAHDPRATNLHMLDFETATNVDEALLVANRAGGPVQNVVVADADGHIGWSLMGQIPVRATYDSTLPHSWREPGGGWTGWRTPQEYPRVVDPASGRLVDGERADDRYRNVARVHGRRWLRPRRARRADPRRSAGTADCECRGHDSDSARRSCVVPHALARSVARSAQRRRARGAATARAGSRTDRTLVRPRCCRRCRLSHRACRESAAAQRRLRIADGARAPALPANEVHAFGAVRRTVVAAGDAASGALARSSLRLMGGSAARLARSRSRRACRKSARNCDAALGARATCCT